MKVHLKLLNIRSEMVERLAGIEPASSAWKAEVIAIIPKTRLLLPLGMEEYSKKAEKWSIPFNKIFF